MAFIDSPEVEAVIDGTTKVSKHSLHYLVVNLGRVNTKLSKADDRIHDARLACNRSKEKFADILPE